MIAESQDLYLDTVSKAVVQSSAVIEFAKVAELADAPDLGSGTERCGGSSPPFRTISR